MMHSENLNLMLETLPEAAFNAIVCKMFPSFCPLLLSPYPP